MSLHEEPTYAGVCLCHGIDVEGRVAKAKPQPYRPASVFSADDPALVRLIVADNGAAHEIPAGGQL